MTGVEQVKPVATPRRLSRAWHATLAIVITDAFVGQFYLVAHGQTDLSATTNEQNISVLVILGVVIALGLKALDGRLPP
ncbi:MAG: hypothetical protein ACRDP7_40755 [Trebonia sp.]